ncbi:hypothetical protein [Pedobacter jeongneungensis]|uniref:hypothetical protein n=1 Tax=Pedobacter jeongneungensis TaxID=947309 RepID=UPI000469099C|nr:hypothetical protein [Pedobacter jeongneungensis]
MPQKLAGKSKSTNDPGDHKIDENIENNDDLHANEFIRKTNNKFDAIENINKIALNNEVSIPDDELLAMDEGYFEVEEEEEISADEIMNSETIQEFLKEEEYLDNTQIKEDEEVVFENFTDQEGQDEFKFNDYITGEEDKLPESILSETTEIKETDRTIEFDPEFEDLKNVKKEPDQVVGTNTGESKDGGEPEPKTKKVNKESDDDLQDETFNFDKYL